jgi:hypothetical protein
MFAIASSRHSHHHLTPNRTARLAAARRAQRRWMAAFWLMCLAVLLAAWVPRTAAAADIRWNVGVQIGGPGWAVSMPVLMPAPLPSPVVMVPVAAGPQWGGRGAGQLPPPIVFDAPRLAVVPVRSEHWEHRGEPAHGHRGWHRRPFHGHPAQHHAEGEHGGWHGGQH